MSYLQPWLLLTLLVIPILLGAYIWQLRRRRRYAVQFSSLSLIKAALPKQTRWRRHLPFALLLIGLMSLLTAMSRPVAEIEVPLSRTSIILAIDVSLSMCATDVAPNRLTVARDAAVAFIEDQADDTRIGLVAFAGFAELVVPPTNDKDELTRALENFTTSLGTAIGSATLKSIDAIADVNDAVPPSGVNLPETEAGRDELDLDIYQPDIIVLLTDGANSQGPPPMVAAERAAARSVRVYTIGFGTDDPQRMACSQEQLGSTAFEGSFGGGNLGGGLGGGGFGGNIRRFLVIDETTLSGMADLTGGEYYRAENADQLLDVFLNLPNEIVLQTQTTEISFVFAIVGALFVCLALLLSMLWNRTL